MHVAQSISFKGYYELGDFVWSKRIVYTPFELESQDSVFAILMKRSEK